MSETLTPRDVLDFWFAAGEEKWFTKDDAFDQEITERFQGAHEAAKEGAYDAWTESTEGCLALIILLDQFPRNIYRNSAKAFAADPKALALAKDVVARGVDAEVPADARTWLYLPFEHSEDMADQQRCMDLFGRLGDEEKLKWAKLHADIIEKFGRFPHRNSVLGRESTAEEIEFLENGGFGG